MDWYTIKHLYPLAFEKFIKIMYPNIGVISLVTLESYDIKQLYSFFDKQGIFLLTELISSKLWVYNISTINNKTIGMSKNSKPTREEIEIEGFYECFNILEHKIINNY